MEALAENDEVLDVAADFCWMISSAKKWAMMFIKDDPGQSMIKD